MGALTEVSCCYTARFLHDADIACLKVVMLPTRNCSRSMEAPAPSPFSLRMMRGHVSLPKATSSMLRSVIRAMPSSPLPSVALLQLEATPVGIKQRMERQRQHPAQIKPVRHLQVVLLREPQPRRPRAVKTPPWRVSLPRHVRNVQEP